MFESRIASLEHVESSRGPAFAQFIEGFEYNQQQSLKLQESKNVNYID